MLMFAAFAGLCLRLPMFAKQWQWPWPWLKIALKILALARSPLIKLGVVRGKFGSAVGS